jgi:hypothetical protein
MSRRKLDVRPFVDICRLRRETEPERRFRQPTSGCSFSRANACAGAGASSVCSKTLIWSGLPVLAAYCLSKVSSAISDITAIASGTPYTELKYNSESSAALARFIHPGQIVGDHDIAYL